MPRPTSQDLAGYWDLLQLSVEDVRLKFDELHQLKLGGWNVVGSPERKVIVPAPHAPARLRESLSTPWAPSLRLAPLRQAVTGTCVRRGWSQRPGVGD